MSLLSRLAAKLDRRDLVGREGLYLSRYMLASFGPIHVYLHHFHRADEDRELHNHPWKWAAALILSGGYLEERLDGALRERTRGSLILILADTFHRIGRVDPDTWTLFVTGPRAQSWGFWNRDTGTFTPWRDFISAKGIPIR